MNAPARRGASLAAARRSTLRPILPIERQFECGRTARLVSPVSWFGSSSRGLLDGQRFAPQCSRSPDAVLVSCPRPKRRRRKCCPSSTSRSSNTRSKRRIAAGAEKLVFITGSSKRAIEDHFDTDAELERQLAESRQARPARIVRNIVPPARDLHLRPPGHSARASVTPCSARRPAVGNEPFFVHLADDLIYSDVPCLQQMAQHYRASTARACSASRPCRDDQTGSYGIVAVETEESGAQRVKQIVEKPKPADAPSNAGGRRPLHPDAGDLRRSCERTQRGAGGEIQLTDGIAALLADEPVHVLPFTGHSLRLRQQDRLPAGDGRVRPAPSGARRQLPRLSSECLGALTTSACRPAPCSATLARS